MKLGHVTNLQVRRMPQANLPHSANLFIPILTHLIDQHIGLSVKLESPYSLPSTINNYADPVHITIDNPNNTAVGNCLHWECT